MIMVRLAGMADAPRGVPKRVCTAGHAICLVRCDDGTFFAVDDACTHEEDARLSDGWVCGRQIECSRHNSIFDLESGEVLSIPATEPLRTYRTLVDGSDVLVELP